MVMDTIYLDNAATTPLDERVKETMLPYLTHFFGNPSSVHQFGRKAKVLLEDARDEIANFIGARPSELYFTSGGTEANNFAIKGIAFNQLGFTPDGEEKRRYHIISTSIEHSAVIDTLEYLKNRFGFEITYLKTDRFGEIDLDEFLTAINEDTFLVSVMHANNELGILNSIASISEVTKGRNIMLHTDAVQSLGKVKFNVNELYCDTAALSAHKIYGPKGIGALYIRKDTQIDKFIHGGKQERDRRGGTENIAAIAGFQKAVQLLKKEMKADIEKYKLLKKKLDFLLKQELGDKVIFNSKEGIGSLHNIVNISFNPANTNVDPDTLLIKLDLKGIAVSSGSACTSGTVKPSHVLNAIGADDKTASSSVRISFGRFNTESDVDAVVLALKDITG
jgi:cysteine desulfurase